MYEEFQQEIRRKRSHALSNMRIAMESRGCSEKKIQEKMTEIEEYFAERLSKLKSIEVVRNLQGKEWDEV